MRRFRVAILPFCLIWLLPAGAFFSHSSSEGTLLGRYTPGYAVFLLGYTLIFLGLLALLIVGTPATLEKILRPLRWLQKRSFLLLILFYAMGEVLYALWRIFRNSDLFVSRHFVTLTSVSLDRDRLLVMLFVLLAELYLAGLLLFAGRDRAGLRDTLLNLILAAFSIGVSFVVFAYGYALIIDRQRYFAIRTHAQLEQADPVLEHTGIPNLDGYGLYFPEADTFIPISTDAQGFRNQGDVTDAPIVGIGDSFLFGEWVADDQVWSVKLSQELGLPVANYSMIGYRLWQYNRLADRYVRQGQHQVVFYGVFANDLEVIDDAHIHPELTVAQKQRSLSGVQSPLRYTFKTFFIDESPGYQIASILGEWLQPDKDDTQAELPYGLAPGCLVHVPRLGEREKAIIAQRLDQAIELSQEMDYVLLIVLLPSKEAVYYNQLSPTCSPEALASLRYEQEGFAYICDTLSARDVPCYDLTGDLRAAAETEGALIYFQQDGHWNPRGHEIVARLLAGYIEAQHWLTP